MDTFAKALHAGGRILSADLGRKLLICPTHESPWSFADVAATDVDAVITMDTYATSLEDFKDGLAYGLSTVGAAKLGVGLSNYKLETMRPFNFSEVQDRFDAITASGVRTIGVWQAPLQQDWWWSLIRTFRSRTLRETNGESAITNR